MDPISLLLMTLQSNPALAATALDGLGIAAPGAGGVTDAFGASPFSALGANLNGGMPPGAMPMTPEQMAAAGGPLGMPVPGLGTFGGQQTAAGMGAPAMPSGVPGTQISNPPAGMTAAMQTGSVTPGAPSPPQAPGGIPNLNGLGGLKMPPPPSYGPSGVTGGVKAPEMSKMSGGSAAIQAALAALIPNAPMDPLRVPALGALLRR